ncbi:hypothetical protein L345_04588, partial [Ophiophagus hannah]
MAPCPSIFFSLQLTKIGVLAKLRGSSSPTPPQAEDIISDKRLSSLFLKTSSDEVPDVKLFHWLNQGGEEQLTAGSDVLRYRRAETDRGGCRKRSLFVVEGSATERGTAAMALSESQLKKMLAKVKACLLLKPQSPSLKASLPGLFFSGSGGATVEPKAKTPSLWGKRDPSEPFAFHFFSPPHELTGVCLFLVRDQLFAPTNKQWLLNLWAPAYPNRGYSYRTFSNRQCLEFPASPHLTISEESPASQPLILTLDSYSPKHTRLLGLFWLYALASLT